MRHPQEVSALQTLTPPELDELFVAAELRRARFAAPVERLRKLKGECSLYSYEQTSLDEAEASLAAADAELAPMIAEWKLRGGWTRFWLVTNSDGHIHRERSCSTLHVRTLVTLVTELSGADDEQVVEYAGHVACTVCFPQAPLHPAFIRSAAEAEAVQAAKDADSCSGSGSYAENVDLRRYSPRGRCPGCGQLVSVTRPQGKIRKHKKPSS